MITEIPFWEGASIEDLTDAWKHAHNEKDPRYATFTVLKDGKPDCKVEVMITMLKYALSPMTSIPVYPGDVAFAGFVQDSHGEFNRYVEGKYNFLSGVGCFTNLPDSYFDEVVLSEATPQPID